MILFAQFALIAWPVIVLLIFAGRDPRRAMIASYIAAWLFLPGLSMGLPGLPDYTKATATSMSILFATLIFDAGRLTTFRFKVYDLPILAWCVIPFFSSVSIGIGAYEGVSAVLFQVVSWGFPYLIGRLYLREPKDARDLAVGIVIGGLVYIPFCLIEIRLSPLFDRLIYGLVRMEAIRYGTFRPRVFLADGLELGTWNANATLISYWLWASGAVRTIRGVSIGRLTVVLLVNAILCKSTGALVLMLTGMAILWISGRTGKPWLVWIIALTPPAYEFTRYSGLWSGIEVVNISSLIFGTDRGGSFAFRLMNEERLFTRVRMHPWLGWGRFGGFQQANKGYTVETLDGYWLIVLGINGILGLVAMTTAWLLPTVVMIVRLPARAWKSPEFGPTVVLCMVTALYMIDNISNAMINPIYGLILGGLIQQITARPKREDGAEGVDLEAAFGLLREGRAAEAEPAFRRSIALLSGRDGPEDREPLAGALEGLGDSLMGAGTAGEAAEAYREAIEFLESAPDGSGDPGHLAISLEKRARALVEVGRSAEAIQLRQRALATWEGLAQGRATDPEIRARRVDALNDLAWLLATGPDPELRDPVAATRLAEEAALVLAGPPASWNTLGVARYRSGDWAGAVEALRRSTGPDPAGGTAFDHYFLAMACHQLGDEVQAIAWLDRADAWTGRHRRGHPALAQFRQEAVGLIDGPASTPGRPA